ncbi:MAG: TIR domain-containing protein [Isosphaeraceae bacterium]
MAETPAYEYDVFISYRKKEPDEIWVQDELYPALKKAGLRVMLDVEDFVPGRNIIEEIERAGRESRHALCVISPDYLVGDRLIHFESLLSRFRDPSGARSGLIPLLYRETELPRWLEDLVPLRWTAKAYRREWGRLLTLLGAKDHDAEPPPVLTAATPAGQDVGPDESASAAADEGPPPAVFPPGLKALGLFLGLLEAWLIWLLAAGGTEAVNVHALSLTNWQKTVALAVPGVLLLFLWPAHVWANRPSFTRERFALASAYAIGGSGVLALISALAGATPWGLAFGIVRALFGFPASVHRLSGWGYLSLFLLPLGVFLFLFVAHRRWDGLISLDEQQFRKNGASPRFWQSAADELAVWNEQKRRRKLAVTARARPPLPAVAFPEWPQDWPTQAMRLIGMRRPDDEYDEDRDWHGNRHCWVGRNARTGGRVAVLCPDEEPDEASLGAFLEYVRSLPGARAGEPDRTEFLVAVRDGQAREETVRGQPVSIVTEASLLDGLVKFRDYFNRIRRRVERDTLPESDLTLKDMYVVSDYRIWEDADRRADLEAYLESWLTDPSRRQIALLGEYGQGKSTFSLMFAYRLINREGGPPRIPILIELRGRSPRSMTPRDILGIWANQNRVDAESLEKLNEAGRLLLILEGFDEMDLVGDAARRTEHFLALWRLCGPKSKLLITGRPNFFLDNQERDRALRIDRSAAGRPYCEPVYLMPFDLRQIREALRRLDERTCAQICSLAERDAKFREVIGRPSLLYIVGLIWTSERLGERESGINSAVVMDLFIRRSEARQESKTEGSPNFMFLTAAERSYFMQGVAAYMAARRLPNQITAEQLDEAIELLCEAIPDEVSTGPPPGPSLAEPLNRRIKQSTHGMDSVKTDVRSCGLLAVDLSKTGTFRFAHKSFMEYLTAQVLAGKAWHDFLFLHDPEPSSIPRVERGGEGPRMQFGADSGICNTARLDLAHLWFYPESLAFFAELVLLLMRNHKFALRICSVINKISNQDKDVSLIAIYYHLIMNYSCQSSFLIFCKRHLLSVAAFLEMKAPWGLRTSVDEGLARWKLIYPCCRAVGVSEDVFDEYFRHNRVVLEFLKKAPGQIADSSAPAPGPPRNAVMDAAVR